MCLGMANGYREPKKINETSNVAEVTKTLQRILETSNEPIGDRFFANITTKTIKDVLDVLTQQQTEIEKYKNDIKKLVEKHQLYKDNINATREYQIEQAPIETSKKVFKATINKILSIKGHYTKIDGEFIEIESPEFLDELEHLFGMEFCEFNEDYEEELENLIKNLLDETKTSVTTEEQTPTEPSQKMSIYEFAEGLNGRQRCKEIYSSEKQLAKELGFVVLFGYSDDCAEFLGAYEEEIDCFGGGRVYEDGDKYIDAVWCGNNGYDWSYNTNIEHATFDIYDNEVDKYCRGIVFKK